MANRAGRFSALRALAILALLMAVFGLDRLPIASAAFRLTLLENDAESEDPETPASLPFANQAQAGMMPFQQDNGPNNFGVSPSALDIPPTPVCPGTQAGTLPSEPPVVWGIVGLRGYPVGQHVASNGVEFNQLFAAELNLNLWVWKQHGIYLFTDSTFWGQKAGPGITNPTQGSFDFSKREFDLAGGFAWNYYGPWEARVFAYSFNNLNRGNSLIGPSGFNDGVGLENRFYLTEEYQKLGTAAFDVARASFVSVGYYPSKSMVDGLSNQFKPGAFARGYFVQNIWGPQYYLYADVDLIAARSFTPTLLNLDVGLAARPFQIAPRLEFRVGTEDVIDLHNSDREFGVYLGIRYVF